MRIAIKLLICFVVFAFIHSCTNQHPENYIIKSFDKESLPFSKDLKGEKMEIDGLVFPKLLLYLKNHLVVSENRADTLLHVIDTKSKTVKRRIGIFGYGPGEIEKPKGLYPTVNNTENEFIAYQISKRQLDRFNIDRDSPLSVETFKLSELPISAVYCVYSSDSTFMSITSDGNDKFVEFDKNGNILNKYDTWDHMLDKDYPASAIAQIHQGTLNVDLSKNYYALACRTVDRIEILNKNEFTVTSIRGPRNHVPKFTVDRSTSYAKTSIDRKTLIYCYTEIVFGDKIIYALFSGSNETEVNKDPNGKFNNDIFIFDFQGNVKGHYTLDYSISDLAVDEVGRKFYGIMFNEDPADIVVFDF